MEMKSAVVTPGQRLGSLNDFESGVGTYIRAQYIYSSRVGFKNILPAKEGEKVILKLTFQ